MIKNVIRSRVGGIVFNFDEKKVLLMYRFVKSEGEYYCAIGGGVDFEENIDTALKREVFEEANIVLEDPKLWFEFEQELFDQKEYFYHATKFYGEIKLGYPELGFLSPENIFVPKFVDFNQITNMKILPPILKEKIIEKIYEP